MYPSGAINGTVVDLAKFAAALMPQEGEKSPLFKSKKLSINRYHKVIHPMTYAGECTWILGIWGSKARVNTWWKYEGFF